MRGNQKQCVFKESRDFNKYLELLKKYKFQYNIKILGFCLMPNHIHLIIQLKRAKGLPKFMQKLNRAYTAYFNQKYQIIGQLWQGRFRSKIITMDKYLLDCINYVELNPVRAKITSSNNEYTWSSYRERILKEMSGRHIVDDLNI